MSSTNHEMHEARRHREAVERQIIGEARALADELTGPTSAGIARRLAASVVAKRHGMGIEDREGLEESIIEAGYARSQS